MMNKFPILNTLNSFLGAKDIPFGLRKKQKSSWMAQIILFRHRWLKSRLRTNCQGWNFKLTLLRSSDYSCCSIFGFFNCFIHVEEITDDKKENEGNTVK